MHLLTASRLTKFQRCARAHHYRYELGVAPVTKAIHACSLDISTTHKGTSP